MEHNNADEDVMLRVFKAQQEYRWKLRDTTADERVKKLRKLYEVILKYTDEIIEVLYKDFKKPAEETMLTEIYSVTTEIKHIIRLLPRWMKGKRIRTPISHLGAKCRIKYEPKGVSLIISPWNFPFQLSISPLTSAIAAGNCVILKPSEYSVETSKLLKRMLGEVFEEKEIAVFEGDYSVSQKLLELPFDNIFFTGSPAVGRIVMSAAAKNLTTVTLELGGKSPAIITSSADIDEAARKIAWGKCLNAGQICVAPDYTLVPEDKAVEFVDKIKYYVNKYYGEASDTRENLKYCRIINKKHFFRIKNLVDEAVDKGARIECGGIFDERDNFISPTVLTNVSPDCKILEEEIFGPVLPVITYKELDGAVKFINSRPKPLALYIFTRSKKTTNYLLGSTESGDVLINDVILHVANVNLPFGGFNNSGIGKSHGFYGFMAFTHERSLMKQGKVSAAGLTYPPFTDRTRKLIDILIKHL